MISALKNPGLYLMCYKTQICKVQIPGVITYTVDNMGSHFDRAHLLAQILQENKRKWQVVWLGGDGQRWRYTEGIRVTNMRRRNLY
jgi:hypothetical protein